MPPWRSDAVDRSTIEHRKHRQMARGKRGRAPRGLGIPSASARFDRTADRGLDVAHRSPRTVRTSDQKSSTIRSTVVNAYSVSRPRTRSREFPADLKEGILESWCQSPVGGSVPCIRETDARAAKSCEPFVLPTILTRTLGACIAGAGAPTRRSPAMTRRRIVLLSAAAVVALVGAALLTPLSSFRGPIETAASGSLGRAVTIRGSMNLTLFPELGIAHKDVAVANSPGEHDPEMMTVGKIIVGARLGPLLSGRLDGDQGQTEAAGDPHRNRQGRGRQLAVRRACLRRGREPVCGWAARDQAGQHRKRRDQLFRRAQRQAEGVERGSSCRST